MIFSKKPTYDWLIVGLGNPTSQYDNTRHNIGFAAVDRFMNENGGSFNKNKYDALFGECCVSQNRLLVVKPQTYMNRSGQAV